MERCWQTITWAHLCHIVGTQTALVVDRFVSSELRFTTSKQRETLLAAATRASDDAAATKWPYGIPCRAIVQDFAGLATILGVTARDLEEAAKPK